jgi:hypothetical protein
MYDRFRMNDGCPFCSPRGPRNYGERFEDSAKPDYAKADPFPAPPAPATTPAPVAPQALASAVASAAANPTLTKEQAAALAAKVATTVTELDLRPGADGYLNVNFGQLASFKLEPPSLDAGGKPGSVERIPEPLRKLDGRHVRMSGFMLPIKVEGGLATEFLVVRSPLVCCYGMMPAPNEWVCVKAPGKGVAMQMDTPLQFSGTFHVGEIYENNFFVGVYRMDADKVSVD